MNRSFSELWKKLDPDRNVRGKQFEHIVKWYLEHDPYYRRELIRVDLWANSPHRWKKADCGIDLIAEHRDGTLWAIQAKAYAPDYSITKKDIDTFLTESSSNLFSFRLLVGSTDHVAPNAEDAIKRQVIPVGRRLRTDLEQAEVNWPSTPGMLRAPKPKPKSPLPHQREAIADVIRGFKHHDRGQLISAPGTGKTLTALFICQKLRSSRTLILLPSISLLDQTLTEWMTNATADFAALPVCSDESVNQEDDIPLSRTSSLGYPVTTDPKAIAAFLRESGSRVVFSTYQSSPELAKALKLRHVPGFDLIIADEAHRTATSISSIFATVLDNHKIPSSRRLFMTATPKIYTVKVLKAAKEVDFEQASMDNKATYGPVFHELSFGEAISRRLLSDYQVAIIGTTDNTYRNWAQRGRFIKFTSLKGEEIKDARSIADQVALAKAMGEYGLRRIITFHSRVKAAEAFAALLPQVVAWMPKDERPSGDLQAEYVSGLFPADERKRALQRLRNLAEGKRAVLSNARCLSEGIDVPALDGVMFIDPKRSMIDIVQAVGRAIRRDPNNRHKIGTIILPVFVAIDENHEFEIDHSIFKNTYDALLALRAIDKRFAEEIDEIRCEMGPRPPTTYDRTIRMPSRTKLNIPGISEDFSRAFISRIIEMTSASWDAWFALLEEYAAEHRTASVRRYMGGRGSAPFLFKGYPLGRWVSWQRHLYSKNDKSLSAERRQRLESLPGWSWNARSDHWEQSFSRLVAYMKEHGDALVPVSYVTPDGYRLGVWVNTNRTAYAADPKAFSTDRKQRLEALGWTWDVKKDQHDQWFELLEDYVAEHGDALVPQRYVVGNRQLGKYVNKLRQRKSGLDEGLIARLEALKGWSWDPYADQWAMGLAYLKAYAQENGDALVPHSYVTDDGYGLGNCLAKQRRDRKTLETARVDALESIPGWAWDAKEAKWEKMFSLLEGYVAKNGTARVPAKAGPLGRWVAHQRELKKKKDGIDSNRVRRLEELDDWAW